MVNDETVLILTVGWADTVPPAPIQPDTPFQIAAGVLVNLMISIYDVEQIILAVNFNFLTHERDVYCIELFAPPSNVPKLSVTGKTEYEAMVQAQDILAARYFKMLNDKNGQSVSAVKRQ